MKKYNYNSPKWVLKRNKAFERDNYKCRGCESKEDIQCHHSYYIPNRELWEYPLESLITLCDKCHCEFHSKIKGSQLVVRKQKDIEEKLKEEHQNRFIISKKTTIKKVTKSKVYYKKKVKTDVIKTKTRKPKKEAKLTPYQKALKYKRENPI